MPDAMHSELLRLAHSILRQADEDGLRGERWDDAATDEVRLAELVVAAHPAEAHAIALEIRDLYTEFENTDNVDYHDYVSRMTRLAIDLSAEVI